MAITVDYSSSPFRIKIPQADLTLISGSLYELDTDAFWDDVKALEAAETGIVFQDMQSHNAEYTVAGVTYAPKVEILNGTNSSNIDVYEVFFDPDTQYSVRLAGSNNNIFDLENAILANTTTQIIPQNSAGLIFNAASSIGQGDLDNIAGAVWDEATSAHTTAGTFGEKVGLKLLTFVKWLGLK